MSNSMTVHLQIPEFIAAGLASGEMQRVGGVIRYTDNKRIIAWLRDGGKVRGGASASSRLMQSVLETTGKSATTVGNILGSVMPVLNIAFAGYALLRIIGSIESNEEEIEAVYERVEAEFRRDRLTELYTALEIARRLPYVNDAAVKAQQVGHINEALVTSQMHAIQYANDFMADEVKKALVEQAARYGILAMQITAMQARCWLEIGEVDSALEWLSYGWEQSGSLARNYVHRSLGESRAYFFHESVSREAFDRFIGVEQWLRGKRDVLPDIVNDNYESFWNQSALDSISFVRIPGTARIFLDPPPYISALDHCEILIEDYQRLEGFKLELQSKRRDFDSWENIVGDVGAQIDEHDAVVLLVEPDETLD